MFIVSTVNTPVDTSQMLVSVVNRFRGNVFTASADSKESDQTAHMSPPCIKHLVFPRITDTLTRLG